MNKKNMKDLNIVMISGRVSSVKYSATKKGNEFASVGIVTNTYIVKNGKTESYPTFVTIMVFDRKQVEYLKDVSVTKGDFINATAKLSNTRNHQNAGYVQLSLSATDIIIARRGKESEEPNMDDIVPQSDEFIGDF